MAAPKGRPKPEGAGRKKGTPNKNTAALRDMILQALHDQEGGGIGYLKTQAQNNPTAFLTLLGKVLPTEVKADISATVQTITRRIVDAGNLDD